MKLIMQSQVHVILKEMVNEGPPIRTFFTFVVERFTRSLIVDSISLSIACSVGVLHI